MAANYNNAAWFYDRLSRLVFGNRLLQAQEFLLDYIPANSHVLIAGGGTGKILELLTHRHPAGLTIIYAEVSEKMIALSEKRHTGSHHITFVTGAAEEVQPGFPFDVILAPFLLDNFSDKDLQTFLQQANVHLKPGGLWLCADFQLNGKWWQPVLLKTMYLFFKLLGCVGVTKLPDIAGAFQGAQHICIAQKNFYGNFIHAAVYKKT